ncbi:hypothetical protein DXG01_016813 [Tephrocybe rancida]|nr:hypothetical protein DXG01_016813 [Tephrocybe rancida]
MAPVRTRDLMDQDGEGSGQNTQQPAGNNEPTPAIDESEVHAPLTYTFLNEMSSPPVLFEAFDYIPPIASTVDVDDPSSPESHLHTQTASPQRTSHGKRRDASYIPRPPNAFILFRSSFIRDQKVTNKVEGNHSNLSKIIGIYWKTLPKSQRDEWEAKAANALVEHRKRYPDWRFRPASNANANANTQNKSKAKEGGRRTRAKKDPPDRTVSALDGDVGIDVNPDEGGRRERGRDRGRGRGRGRPELLGKEGKETRFSKIAGLLKEGREGVALERAVEEWEAERREGDRTKSVFSARDTPTSIVTELHVAPETIATPTTPSTQLPSWPSSPVTPHMFKPTPSWPASPQMLHATTSAMFNPLPSWPKSPSTPRESISTLPKYPPIWPASPRSLTRRSHSRSPSVTTHITSPHVSPNSAHPKRSLSAPAPQRRSQGEPRLDAGFWWPSHTQCERGEGLHDPMEEEDMQRVAEPMREGSFEEALDLEPVREGSFDALPASQEFAPMEVNDNMSVDGWGWEWREEKLAAYGEVQFSTGDDLQVQPTAPPPQWAYASIPSDRENFQHWESNAHAGDSIHPLPPTPISPFSLSRSSFSSLAGWDGSDPSTVPNMTPIENIGPQCAGAGADPNDNNGLNDAFGPWGNGGAGAGGSWGRASGIQSLGVQGGSCW